MARLLMRNLGLVVFATCACMPFAHALTIETVFVPAGQIINGVGVAEAEPSSTVGGGNLAAVVRAAANAWEAVIADDHHVTLNFGWAPTGSVSSIALHQGLYATGDPERQALGSLAFNSRYASSTPLYLDPTPWQSDEFEFSQQGFVNLGGGTVEVMRELTLADSQVAVSRDLYSTALHEIGHALGMAGWDPFVAETEDSDIDVTIAPFAGTTIPVAGQHLAIAGPNLTNTDYPLGRRREITQVDLLAVCQLSSFEACDLSLRPMYRAGDGNLDGDVDGSDYLAWQQGHQPANRSVSSLSAWQDTYGSPLYPFGDFNHDRAVGGQDFLDWQRGESLAQQSEIDLSRWKANYNPAKATVPFSAIPEPSALAILAQAALLLCWRNRRR